MEEGERGLAQRQRPDFPLRPPGVVRVASCKLVTSQPGLPTAAPRNHSPAAPCPHPQSPFPLSFLGIFAAFPEKRFLRSKQKPGPTSSFSRRAKLSPDQLRDIRLRKDRKWGGSAGPSHPEALTLCLAPLPIPTSPHPPPARVDHTSQNQPPDTWNGTSLFPLLEGKAEAGSTWEEEEGKGPQRGSETSGSSPGKALSTPVIRGPPGRSRCRPCTAWSGTPSTP